MAIEEPRYESVATHEAFEVRRYPPHLVAETEVEGDFEDAGNQAFRILADFIFGNNRSREKIAMTAPVTQRAEGERIGMTAPVAQVPAGQGRYRITFAMPVRYTLETLPEPVDPRVQIRTIPERWVAARRYSGTWSRSRYLRNEALLREALAEAGWQTAGDPEWARYNSPFSLWFLRRNEVLIEVVPRSDAK